MVAEIHTDETLSKVRTALLRCGYSGPEADSVINVVLNASIVFRELVPADPMPADSDEVPTLDSLVYTALGAASMCWTPDTGDAVFDSEQATKIGTELVRSLRARGAH